MDKELAMAAVLATIIEMSDAVANHSSPLDMQGKLLRMQNSIQKNKPRILAMFPELSKATGDAS